ncbi:TIGR02444 family protein [Rheinheimera riviphila]|uniref:TIGR02444 family protein n=1 Tax=Rheinheimera riviphila TaxID=1834037 RepID=A0A437QZA6_9GAMM|nr:TIGR02444 family protein [Rheinheimera riviphila]RVU39872.1 TIGR02444 family protein [Rheinheimera riviphila]
MPDLNNDQLPWPDPEQFWHWSLALYPGIKPLALQWQDELGVNVNLLLLLLYLQRRQLLLTTTEIESLQQSVQSQQQLFTAPLRQLRRQLPAHLSEPAAASFKQQLLQAELCSEKLEQQQLIQCLHSFPLRAAAPDGTLLPLYLQLLQIDPAPRQQQMFDLDQAAAIVGVPPA